MRSSFLAVLRKGSLSGAARALGLAQPTMGGTLRRWSRPSGGLPLFTRSGHGLRPTEAALELRPHAKALAASAAALLRAASREGSGTRGVARITASQVVGAEVPPPIRTRLQQEHPGLVVELVLSNGTEDLLRREEDIAVRTVQPAPEARVARRMGTIGMGLHAHRDYLNRCGVPVVLDDLRAHALVGFDRETAFIRGLRERGVALHLHAAHGQRPCPACRYSRGLWRRRYPGATLALDN